jgi:hypothetical protein
MSKRDDDILTVINFDDKDPYEKIEYLMSEGNRRIIQSSHSKEEIEKAASYMNNLNAKFEGKYREKFYRLK